MGAGQEVKSKQSLPSHFYQKIYLRNVVDQTQTKEFWILDMPKQQVLSNWEAVG